jgi:hypothetical protein
MLTLLNPRNPEASPASPNIACFIAKLLNTQAGAAFRE